MCNFLRGLFMTLGTSKKSVEERSMVAVSLATVASRISGLLRDMVLFALLGLTDWSSAFLFALTVPNLFRRLLGEGALTSAMVPLFAETLEEQSQQQAFAFLNRILSRLSIILFAIIAFFVVIFLFVWPALPAHWQRALGLTTILVPYLLFVCPTAMLSGALNVLGSFGLPALTALLLNLSMLFAGIIALLRFPAGGLPAALILCVSVLVGGIIQLILPWKLLRRRGWKFRWDHSTSPILSRLWRIFLPAVLGAAMVQINVTISRLIAYAFTSSGISTLYLSSRLVEVPLGIFAIAITSVAFPGLSRLATETKRNIFGERYRHAHWSILMVTIPSAIGLILLGKNILTALFAWGNYSGSDIMQTFPVLAISAIGIPFFAVVGIDTRAFHAKQDMKTPLRIACWGIFCNIFLTIILAKFFGAAGIALSNVLSAMLQWVLLRKQLSHALSGGTEPRREVRKTLILACANGLLLLFLLAVSHLWDTSLPPRVDALLHLCVVIPVVVIGYVTFLQIFRFEEVSLFFSFLRPSRGWRKK
ncbi:MAG: murein biosynthesis integral membrane protein MurJ [Puniceicoccales bacterium]|nr:murein biosynthesis integral membrane protein MurJ [Puniceicoccales bacterium]